MDARAKVNLTLEILGVRADGYHDIRSLAVPVSLADEVSLEPADETSLKVVASSPDIAAHVGPNDRNLAFRAAQAMRAAAGRKDGVAIKLVKNIPVGAGLGGGSADAAAVLNGLNAMWKLGLSHEELAVIGAGLGSDVPAQLFGGTVLMEGRGERVTRERPGPVLHLVLAFPGVFVSTANVYSKCITQLTTGGEIVDNMRRALSGGDAAEVAAALYNGLADAAEALHPEISCTRKAVLAAGALGALMAGSGSCVFGLAHDASHACEIAHSLARAGLDARPVHTCPVM